MTTAPLGTEALRLLAEFRVEANPPREETVEQGRVRDFLLALGEPADLAPETRVPPLFLLTLGRTRRPPLRAEGGGVINGGDDIELFSPVYAGDVIRTVARVVEVKEKRGKTGRIVIFTVETTYTNQLGRRVGVGRRTLIGLAK